MLANLASKSNKIINDWSRIRLSTINRNTLNCNSIIKIGSINNYQGITIDLNPSEVKYLDTKFNTLATAAIPQLGFVVFKVFRAWISFLVNCTNFWTTLVAWAVLKSSPKWTLTMDLVSSNAYIIKFITWTKEANNI